MVYRNRLSIFSAIKLLNISRQKNSHFFTAYFIRFSDVMVEMPPLEICYLLSHTKKYIKTILEARNKYFPQSVYVPLHKDSDYIQFLAVEMWKEKKGLFTRILQYT